METEMTNNLIIIKGGVYNNIKESLGQWISIYRDNLKDDFTFELYKNGQSNHIIKVDNRLGNELFFFLINYLKYPEGIESKISIEGFTTGKNDNIFKNKKLLVFISSADEEYDSVFVTTSENRTYRYDFEGKIGKIIDVKLNRNYKQPPDFSLENPKILNISEYIRKSEEISVKRIDKRFKIISFIGLVLLLIAHVIYLTDIDTFLIIFCVIEIGISGWFLSDYKMLQSNRHYIYCLLISIAFLGYGLLLKETLNFNIDPVIIVALYPLSLLVIQKPARLIFKSYFGFEPVVDKPAPTIEDGVYSLILIFGSMGLSFIMFINWLR